MKADLAALAHGAAPAVRESINALRSHAVASALPGDRAAVEAALDKRAAHAKQGRAAQRGGASSEDAVEGVLRGLLMRGIVADFQRNDATVKASGGKVLRRIAGPCDFTGIFATREGFAIEVKSGARLWRSEEHADAARRSREPHLTARQSAQLFRYDAADCLSLVVWVVDGVPRAMPWHVLTSLWSPAGCVVAAEWEKVSTLQRALEERGSIEGGRDDDG